MRKHPRLELLLVSVLLVVLSQGLFPLRAQEPVDLNTALQNSFDQFPLLKPLKDDRGNAQFTRLTLNKKAVVFDGKRYDGFKFRVDREGHSNFVWKFKINRHPIQWYIVPRTGMMNGFVEFGRLGKGVIVQALDGAELENGQTYLIWFSFTDDRPAELSVAFTFADFKLHADGGFDNADAVKALTPNPEKPANHEPPPVVDLRAQLDGATWKAANASN